MNGKIMQVLLNIPQVLLNIPDVEAPFLMDVLQYVSDVKVKPRIDEKSLLLTEIRSAVEEMKRAKSGKKSAPQRGKSLHGQ
ncbi:MAG: hypothetical protein LBB79_10310 [Prevotellaceae bacterium]|nr:hypothetical protein [Prevotellaceae bacterium]